MSKTIIICICVPITICIWVPIYACMYVMCVTTFRNNSSYKKGRLHIHNIVLLTGVVVVGGIKTFMAIMMYAMSCHLFVREDSTIYSSHCHFSLPNPTSPQIRRSIGRVWCIISSLNVNTPVQYYGC